LSISINIYSCELLENNIKNFKFECIEISHGILGKEHVFMINEDKDLKETQIPNQIINVSDCKNAQIVVTNDKLPSSLDDENSIVAFFLDTFNVKKFLETIANSQGYVKITHNFINIVLLLLFLTFVFWEDGMLTLKKTSATTTLIILVFGAIFELLGANTSIFKGLLDSDTKTKKFIDGLSVLWNNNIENEVTRFDFSPKCLNYFIKKLEDVNSYSQSVVYAVIESQFLTKDNLDRLLSPKVVKNLSKKLILKILFQYENILTQENMENIYNNFYLDNDVVKILIVTQESSDFLINLHSENPKLSKFYLRYQTEKVYLDWKLKIIPINNLYSIRYALNFLIFPALFEFTSVSFDLKHSDNYFLYVLFISIIITYLIHRFLLEPIFRKVYDYYFKHMISNIIKDET
jgi:hypothetical protein